MVGTDRSAGPRWTPAEPEFTDGSISHGELLAAYAPAQLPLALEPCVIPAMATRPISPDGWELGQVRGHAGVYARYVGPDQAISPEVSRSGYLATFLRPNLHFGALDGSNDADVGPEIVATWPLLVPHHPELIVTHLLSTLSEALESGRSAASLAVGALAQLAGPFGHIGHVALVAGLAGAGASTRIAAAETWGQVARQGRARSGAGGGGDRAWRQGDGVQADPHRRWPAVRATRPGGGPYLPARGGLAA